MNDKHTPHQEPILDADAVEEVKDSTHNDPTKTKVKTKAKRNFKLYFLTILILAIGAWAFWTFSPEAQKLRLQLSHVLPQPENSNSPANTTTFPTTQVPSSAQIPSTQNATEQTPSQPEETPLFEDSLTENDITTQDTPSISLPNNTEQAPEPTTDPILGDRSNDNPEIEAHTPEVITTMQQLQQQIDDLTQTIHALQQQQLKWSQQQVRAQLFALLRQAASAQSSLGDMMIAWKSISFLPLLNQDKRNTAEQAFSALQATEQHIQQTETQIQDLIRTLTHEMHPSAVQDIAQEVGNVVDPYQQADAFDSWLDWLKQQFVITKLDQHALELSDDPYADTKQLISQLHTLKTAIHQRQWEDIGSLTALMYQLEQRGLDVPFSNESIASFQADIRHWQDEAQTWMAQL